MHNWKQLADCDSTPNSNGFALDDEGHLVFWGTFLIFVETSTVSTDFDNIQSDELKKEKEKKTTADG